MKHSLQPGLASRIATIDRGVQRPRSGTTQHNMDAGTNESLRCWHATCTTACWRCGCDSMTSNCRRRERSRRFFTVVQRHGKRQKGPSANNGFREQASTMMSTTTSFRSQTPMFRAHLQSDGCCATLLRRVGSSDVEERVSLLGNDDEAIISGTPLLGVGTSTPIKRCDSPATARRGRTRRRRRGG